MPIFGVDLPTNKQKAAQRYVPDHSAQSGEDERLSVVLFFVPTDVDAAIIGLMTPFDAADHGGAG